MPEYKLTYFPIRGRGEPARLLFAAAGKTFEDVRIPFSEWPEKKASMPQCAMPVLEIDGKIKVCQSHSIYRHLAREFNLYGAGNREMCLVDQIMDTCLDLMGPYVSIRMSKDDEQKKKEATDKFVKETVPKMFKFLEDLIAQGGCNGFAVGKSLTVADIVLFAVVELIEQEGPEGAIKDYKLLATNRKTVSELPRIKQYLDKRPPGP